MLNISDALAKIFEFTTTSTLAERIPFEQSVGRVLFEDVMADRDLPPFHRSMMDGFAFAHADIDWAKPIAIQGEVFPGEDKKFSLSQNECIKIFTGASMPAHFDTIVQHEWFDQKGSIFLKQDKTVLKGMNIHAQASDAQAGQILLTKGTILTTRHLAVLASVGKTLVKVSKKLKVAVVTTGNEVIAPEMTPSKTQIRDANLSTLEALSINYAGALQTFGQVPDEKSELRSALTHALESQVVIISAGVSAGEHDFVPEILAELGVEKVFHKIDLKPGHPLWFGVKNKTIVFGLPGNPVSGQVCFKLFVEPAMKKMLGVSTYQNPLLKLSLGESFHKKHPRHEWAMGKINNNQNETIVTAMKHSGSGDFFHYGEADALISFPGGPQTFEAHSKVEVVLL